MNCEFAINIRGKQHQNFQLGQPSRPQPVLRPGLNDVLESSSLSDGHRQSFFLGNRHLHRNSNARLFFAGSVMSFEHLFASSVLNIVVPDTSIEYPPQCAPDEWLGRLNASSIERKQAFFGK